MNRSSIGLAVAAVGLLLVILGVVYRQQTPSWKQYSSDVIEIFPAQTGMVERCLTCHKGLTEISTSHPVAVFGCVSCHGGVGTALDADLAHTELIANPGDLNVAAATCGGCHADHVYRVERSVQATYAGAIATVRRAFGAQPDSTAYMGIRSVSADLAGPETVTAIETFRVDADDVPLLHQFEGNCLRCHLQGEPITDSYFYRATGCSSCHVLYANDGLYQGDDPTISKTEPGHVIRHQMTTAIPYRQCNHCHNRGNYELPTMSFVHRDDVAVTNTSQRRVDEYYQPIGRFTLCEWELDCVDCHTQQEAMGDGHLYNNQSAAQYTQCLTCHGTLDEPPRTHILSKDDETALRMIALNPFIETEPGHTVIITTHGEVLTHIVQQPNGSFELTGRAHGIRYEVPLVMGSTCQQNPEEQESRYCHECHTYER